MSDQIKKSIPFVIGSLIVAFAFAYVFTVKKECESRGGVLIRGALSLECIAKGNLIGDKK